MTKRRAKGEGSLYFNETSQRWVAQISLSNGKRKSKTDKSQKVVRDWLIFQRNQAKQGLFVSDDSIKLGDFLDRYMEDVAEHSLRPTTLQAHHSIITHHIKPELGNICLTNLRPDHVQAFYAKKLREGSSRRYVQYMHSVLHKALKQAFRWGLVTRNVTDLVDPPTSQKKTFKTWSPEDINLFLKAVEDHQWYSIYVLAIYCGMRQGEILGLHKEDVDLEKGVIHVCHQVTYIRSQGLSITEPKTDSSKRPIKVPHTALEAVRKHLEGVEGNLVFTTRSGKLISARNVVRHFKETIERLGLPNIRFHDLRHTHATLLLKEGVHPKVVQERLGHSSIILTLDTYSHVIPSLQTEAADKFESILSS